MISPCAKWSTTMGGRMSTLGFILLLSVYVAGQQPGDLRFRGSFSNEVSGRLEVFINNQWGTICIDGFTKMSANTACRQLGSVEALTFSEADRLGYGQGSGQIHITELECSSDDIHILHCNIRNTASCTHSSDVAVACSSQPAFQFDGGIRLVDGLYRSEGILELYFFGEWGATCGRAFTIVTADAACIALGYSRSRSAPEPVSRFQNVSSPVWFISSSISCTNSRSCFEFCYRDPIIRDDLSDTCTNNFIYLTCEFDTDIESRCLARPFDPDPSNSVFNPGDTSSETDTTAIAITLPIIFGSTIILILFVLCISCGWYKKVGSCCKGSWDCCCGSLEFCFEGCLSILRFFDIRRCFEHRDNRDTTVNTGRTSPNLEPMSTINQELEALEMEAMNQPSGAQRASSSSTDSDHSSKVESNKPPDYRNAVKYVKTGISKKGDDANPSSHHQPLPPSYDSVA